MTRLPDNQYNATGAAGPAGPQGPQGRVRKPKIIKETAQQALDRAVNPQPELGLSFNSLEEWYKQQLTGTAAPGAIPQAPLTTNSNQFLQTYSQNRDTLAAQNQADIARGPARVEEFKQSQLTKSNQSAIVISKEIKQIKTFDTLSSVNQRALLSQWGAKNRDELFGLANTFQSLVDKSVSGDINSALNLNNFAEQITAAGLQQSADLAKAKKEAAYKKDHQGIVKDVLGYVGGGIDSVGKLPNILAQAAVTPVETIFRTGDSWGDKGAQSLVSMARVDKNTIVGTIEKAFGSIQVSAYAWENAMLQGADSTTRTRAFLGGLPGLGFVAGHDDARDYIEQVNTHQERDDLTKDGRLLSIGQYFGGYGGNLRLKEQQHYIAMLTPQFRQMNPYEFQTDEQVVKYLSKGGKGSIKSGLVDAVFTLVQDPTIWAGGPKTSLSEWAVKNVVVDVADDAARTTAYAAARLGVITETELGDNIIRRMTAKLSLRNINAKEITAALGGLKRVADPEIVTNIMRAMSVGGEVILRDGTTATGEHAIRSILVDAFVEGVWDPKSGTLKRLIEHNSAKVAEHIPEWARPKGSVFYRAKNSLTNIASKSSRGIEGLYTVSGREAILNALHLGASEVRDNEAGFLSQIIEDFTLTGANTQNVPAIDDVFNLTVRDIMARESNADNILVLSNDQFDSLWQTGYVMSSDLAQTAAVVDNTIGSLLDTSDLTHTWLVRMNDVTNPQDGLSWLSVDDNGVGRWVADELFDVGPAFSPMNKKEYAQFVATHVSDMGDTLSRLRQLADLIDSPQLSHYVSRLALAIDTVPFESLNPAAQLLLTETLQEAELLARMIRGDYDHLGNISEKVIASLSRYYTPLAESTGAGIAGRRAPIQSMIDEAMLFREGAEWTSREGLLLYESVTDDELTSMADQIVNLYGDNSHVGNYFLAAAASRSARSRTTAANAMDMILSDTDFGLLLAEEVDMHMARREAYARISQVLDVQNANSGLWSRIASGHAKLALSLIEKAPSKLLKGLISPNASVNLRNVIDFVDDYGASLYLTRAEKEILASRSAQIATDIALGGSMDAANTLIRDLYKKIWDRQGLNHSVLREWEEEILSRRTSRVAGRRGEIYRVELTEEQILAYRARPNSLRIRRNGTATIDGVEVLIVLDPSVTAQVNTSMRVLSLRDLQEGVRNELMHNSDISFAKKVRVIITDRAVHVQWENRAAELLFRANSIAELGEKLFKLWKVMVTTRIWTAPLAAAGSLAYLGQDGEVSNDDIWAALGAGVALGAFGATRYRSRMSIQNRLDAWLEHGFVAKEQIPGLAALFRRSERDIYGIARHALSPDPTNPSWITWREGILHTTGEWSAVTLNSSRKSYLSGYDRILNAQLSPEIDEMTRIFLRHPVGTQGVFTDVVLPMDIALRDEIDQFLLTDDGLRWADKMMSTGHTLDEAVETTRRFVQTYAWDTDVAAARLATMGPGNSIDRATIEQFAAEGKLSPVIHAQTLDKSISASALGRSWKRAYENLAYGTTANPGFKESVFAVERARIDRVLRDRGVEAGRATELSIATATMNTNRILFRYDNATRFAHAVDWVMPFTGHRQFNAYMWTRLALENPRNAVALGVHMAQVFNAGKESGIITKDQFGSYRFNVPGSAKVAKLLGVDVAVEMSAPVLGFLAVGSDIAMSQGHGASLFTSYAEQFAPHPGGPFWGVLSATLAKKNPDFFDPATTPIPEALYNFLWPMGVQNTLGIPEDAQVWVALITTSIPPWLMINEQGIERVNQMKVKLARELVAKHERELAAKGLPPDPEWFDRENIDEQVRTQFLALLDVWSLTRSISPTAASVKFPDADRAQSSFSLWKKWNPKMSYSEQRRTFLEANPEMYPYIVFGSTVREKGKAGTYKEWSLPHENDLETGQYAYDKFAGKVHYKSLSQFETDMKVYADRQEYGTALAAARQIPSTTDREEELARLREKYPEQAAYFKDKRIMEEDLASILLTTPEGPGREAAINRWRTEWATDGYSTVSHDTYVTMERSIRNNISLSPSGRYNVSYATHARYGEEVWKDVMKNKKSVWLDNNVLDPAVLWEVATLNPEEQARFWLHARLNMWAGDSGGDSSGITARDKILKGKRREIYANPKWTAGFRYTSSKLYRDGDYAKKVLAEKENGRNTITGLYAQLTDVSKAKNDAYTSKNWGNYATLKAQETALYDEISAFKKDLFDNPVVSVALHEAIAELTYIEQVGSRTAKRKAHEKLKSVYQNTPLEPIDEQVGYDNLNIQQKVAWREDLINALDMAPEDAKGAGNLKRSGLQLRTKLYWDYLTAFQQSVLENSYPHDKIAEWKLITPGMGGKAKTSIAGNEIAFAYAMLQKYDQRNGMAKPPGYADYLALPPSSALRSEYIRSHPKVAEYLRLGGLANMPAVIRGIVTDIMVRNGKWGGEEKTINEITDIAFARQQLETYSKRGSRTRPETFDQWISMPSGPERAAYMSAHPEIGQWVSDGPMANMPVYYRDVVRDIMYRYNEWTTSSASDGIGDMMSEFFKVPAYARTDYLKRHPDLAAYFLASKSPDEQAMQEKLNMYYAIPDTNARKAFLQVHQDVQQYMLTSRHDRYVRFLQQTSMFLSQNPEVFQKYIDNQDEVMKDLLAKFSEPYLVQETSWSGVTNTSNNSEGGRRRK